MKKYKLAVIVSHPIQHFCPQYSSWNRLPNIELMVFFASNHGLVPYEDKGFNRTVKWDGITLDFPYEFLPGAEGKSLEANIDSLELGDRISAFCPDFVVVYGYRQPLQRRAMRLARSRDLPMLMISDSENRSARSFIKQALKLIILPRIYRKVNLFLTVGDANEEYYRRYGVPAERMLRCFFPIDKLHYDSIINIRDICREDIRNQFSIPAHHRVILMVGKLVTWKRQIDLIQFSNLIQNHGHDITVVLVGTGPDEVRLRAATLREGFSGVVFAGFVSPQVLAKFYCAADVYVHCSEREPHSLAISEAIYCGLPVVLSDRCGSYGPTDDVRLGRNGFVYQCGDVEDMARSIFYILRAPGVHARMSDASVRIAREHQFLAHGGALLQALTIIDSRKSLLTTGTDLSATRLEASPERN